MPVPTEETDVRKEIKRNCEAHLLIISRILTDSEGVNTTHWFVVIGVEESGIVVSEGVRYHVDAVFEGCWRRLEIAHVTVKGEGDCGQQHDASDEMRLRVVSKGPERETLDWENGSCIT